jgi:hypothetical protein
VSIWVSGILESIGGLLRASVAGHNGFPGARFFPGLDFVVLREFFYFSFLFFIVF